MIRSRPRLGSGARGNVVALVAAAAIAGPGPAAGQGASSAAVPVVERFDRLTNAYEPVVLLPLPLAAAAALQRALLREGLAPGPITGVVDARTRGALRQFQIDNGLRITGLPDLDTVRRLGLALREATPAEALAAAGPEARRSPGLVIIGPSADVGVPATPETTLVAPGVGVPPVTAPEPHLPGEPAGGDAAAPDTAGPDPPF